VKTNVSQAHKAWLHKTKAGRRGAFRRVEAASARIDHIGRTKPQQHFNSPETTTFNEAVQ